MAVRILRCASGLEISWENGNRTGPSRGLQHPVEIAALQRHRTQDFQTRPQSLPRTHDPLSYVVVIRALRGVTLTRCFTIGTVASESLSPSRVRVNRGFPNSVPLIMVPSSSLPDPSGDE